MPVINILEVVDTPFYEKFDFYLFFILAAVGLLFSILSWLQAKGAKKAAEDAGKIVKIQDILLDIPEITNLCQLDFGDDFRKATPKISTIIGKISLVIGVIKGDPTEYQNQQVLVVEIESIVAEIQNILKSLNPMYMDSAAVQIKEGDGRTYFAISPLLLMLVSKLNLLRGSLHGQLIQNK